LFIVLVNIVHRVNMFCMEL